MFQLLRTARCVVRSAPASIATPVRALSSAHDSSFAGFAGSFDASSMAGSLGAPGPLHGHPLGFAPHSVNAPMHSTTILSVRRRGKVAVVGDGMVSRGSEIVKPNAIKVRRLADGKVISGFAGSTADCLALRERLEAKLEAHPSQLMRACVELAKDWRTEKYLRRLEAVMLVVDRDVSLTITGGGDVMEPVDGIMAVGSGGPFALAAARALLQHTELDAMAIAERAMNIAADMCIYTNHNFVKDYLEYEVDEAGSGVDKEKEAGKEASRDGAAMPASSTPSVPQV